MVTKGQKINDRYEIIKSIGEGGMANVYLAYDTILDRNVAIKVLRGDLANDEKFVRRFQREALSASSLSHPNIVAMYDVGEDNGLYYIVMEYVEGKTLKQLLKKRGSLTLSEAIDIMLQLTDGMAHAHDSYIVHRDLKPQNIMIQDDGQIKITDFGIAMALNSTQLTQTNSVMGSVHYLPPEQAAGKGTTIKSDIYSMGIVMYELLTGELPFKGDNAVEIALKHANNLVVIEDATHGKEMLFSQNYACPDCNISIEELSPRMFSFNNPLGACPECSGIGYLMKMNEDLIIPDKNKTLYDGVKAFGSSTMKKGDTMAKMYFESIGRHYGVDISKPIKKLPKEFMEKILYGTGDEKIDFEYESAAGVRKFTAPFEGVLPTLERRHSETKSQGMRDFYEMYMSNMHCDECNGARLKKEILCIKVGDKNINEITDISIRQLQEFLRNLELTSSQKMIADMILKEIDARLQFLIDVGLEYLTLSRSAGTLSGGEAQRIRLATQIGSGLTGVLYILDEPTTGLHMADVHKLIDILQRLVDGGNTLVVIEHNLDVIKSADNIIDLGPEGGDEGGKVIATGTPEEVAKVKESYTGEFLRKIL